MRAGVPTVSARLALPLLLEWRRRRRSDGELLAPLGLDEDQLRRLEERLPLDVWSALHAACVDATGDAAFAVEAVRRVERAAFPIELHLVSSQLTVAEGLRFVAPYIRSVVDGLEITVTARAQRAHAEFRAHGEPLGPPAFAEYFLALLWAFARTVAPSTRPASAVHFAHRRVRHGDALAAFFEAPVALGKARVGFEFYMPNLDAPIPSADPELGRMLASTAARLATVAAELRMRDRARHWLTSHLVGDEPIGARLAEAMHVSERSLRRKLRDEGTSLRELVDDVRRERAVALLEAGRVGLDRVAEELGFASASAFGRAFRKWTGMPPADFARASRSRA